MTKLKILFVCSDLGIPVLGQHGAAVHVRSLVAAFQRSEHTVLLAAPLLNKSPWEKSVSVPAHVLHVPPSAETLAASLALKTFTGTIDADNPLPAEVRRILYNKDLVRQVKGRFTNDPPDFIYERASLFGAAGVQLANEFNRPLVIELNAPLALEQDLYRGACLSDLAREAERWTLSRADLVVVVSAPLREYAIGLGVDPERVHVVPNGVDPALFRPRWAEGNNGKPRGDKAGPVLGFIGGLRPWHGVDVLPALAARLGRRRPDLRMVIAGDGQLRAQLEQEFDERGLSGRVLFTGTVPHDDVPEIIRAFDVALAPYAQPEHPFYFSPLKLFEYMACGVPVVAARIGQIADVVRDGETGLLYTPGELDELAAACDRLLADPALCRRLGQAAAEEVHARYTWDHNAARVVELVRSLPNTQRDLSTPPLNKGGWGRSRGAEEGSIH